MFSCIPSVTQTNLNEINEIKYNQKNIKLLIYHFPAMQSPNPWQSETSHSSVGIEQSLPFQFTSDMHFPSSYFP